VIELSTIGDMRAWSRSRRSAGRRVGFVPTMGYLHAGHLRLVEEAWARADDVVMSVFVNPLQFAPTEDLDRYPRDIDRDRGLAREHGVACLFVPAVDEMYASPSTVRVDPGSLADHLCGPFRPGHFAGVLTVVAKLLHIVEPDVAVFGRKDVQQARMIERMVRDLDFPLTVVVIPTVRESDGLALSSRNAYLSADERAVAARIPAALEQAHGAFRAGAQDAEAMCAQVRATLAGAGLTVEYVEAVDPEGLVPCARLAPDTLLAVAARVGQTRLIDNIILGSGLAADVTRQS
jgi:pantoate--beta-alanine ligase